MATVSLEINSAGWYITLTDQFQAAPFFRLVFCAQALRVWPDQLEDV